jgi:Arm DNA-binding domain
MALTDAQARNAKSSAKPYKLSDGGWLFLMVNPSGSKLWRVAYRFAGKEKLLALGAYPQLSLKDARTKRDEAKVLLVAGIDPGEQKKADKIATAATQTNALEQIAAELLEKKRSEGKAESTLSKFEWLLSLVSPAIRARQIDSLTPQEILAVLRPIEGSGRRETARRLRAKLGEVFRYAIATGRAEIDPTGSLKGALAAPVVSHRAAIVLPIAFGALLRAISTYEGAKRPRRRWNCLL